MRVKSDFITNSSSTAYVVFIPHDFYPTDEEIQNAVDATKYMFNSKYVNEITDIDIKYIKEKYFEDLKTGYLLDECDEGHRVIGVITHICEQHDFGIIDIETGVGGTNQIIGLKEKIINKMLLKICTDNLKFIEVNNEN